MDIPGIKIDVDKIAIGLYAMIKEHPDGDCLRIGMFPNNLMEALTNSLKLRIPDSYTWRNKETNELNFCEDGKYYRQEIEHTVCCKILHLATEEGYCIV